MSPVLENEHAVLHFLKGTTDDTFTRLDNKQQLPMNQDWAHHVRGVNSLYRFVVHYRGSVSQLLDLGARLDDRRYCPHLFLSSAIMILKAHGDDRAIQLFEDKATLRELIQTSAPTYLPSLSTCSFRSSSLALEVLIQPSTSESNLLSSLEQLLISTQVDRRILHPRRPFGFRAQPGLHAK
jgi:hypothetical protein